MMTTLTSLMTIVGMFTAPAKAGASGTTAIAAAAAVCLGLLIVRRKNRKSHTR